MFAFYRIKSVSALGKKNLVIYQEELCFPTYKNPENFPERF